MFRSALIKLTFLYLAIIMIISLFFSLNLYRISTQEIDRALNKQKDFYSRGDRMFGGINTPELQDYMEEQLLEGKRSVFYQLAYTNFVIFVVGGGISYLLARMTLRPIEESHEAQSRFAADASHELRSPLSAMKSEIEVTLRDPNLDKKEAVRILESNLEEVNKLQKLSEGLLELARDNGDSLLKEEILVSELIKDACEKVSKNAKARKIEIVDSTGDKLSVFGNKESLSELFGILLDNSIKYSEPDKKIVITTHKKDKTVEVRIKDEGFGIKGSDLPHIFDRFYRAEISRSKNKIDGYGLGLSLAKKIVESNKGNIIAESTDGQGTVFMVTLPEK